MTKKQTLVLISNDKVGASMAGPGIRYFELARVLADHFDIRLLVPGECDLKTEQFRIISYNPNPLTLSRQLAGLTERANFVLAQSLPPLLLKKLKKKKIRYIADLYDPLPIEILEYTKDSSIQEANKTYSFVRQSFLTQLLFADHILYATLRQRDYYLGTLSALNVLNPIQYQNDSQAEKLMTCLPFGLDSKATLPKRKNFLSERFPAIKAGDTVLYWGGGIWNWFDPLTVIKAIENCSRNNPSVKLVFLGTKHPNPKIKEMEMVKKALDYAKSRQLFNQSVFFNFGWTPYEESRKYLAGADIGVSAHFRNLETDFSFRTRILGYLSAELPIITTEGDFFAALVEKENLGKVVPTENVEAYSLAVESLIADKNQLEICRRNAGRVKEQFNWINLVCPLVEKINNDSIPVRPTESGANLATLQYYFSGIKKKFL